MIPQTHLDGLLAELHTRLQAVLSTRDRAYALLEAVVSVGGNLDLETVLHRIVETAATLADARYAALGVIGEDDTLARFVPVGLSEEEIARIDHWPHGLGLLGLLIKEPRPLRLARIGDHPRSYGFPAGHPPMAGFLGVPVRVRGRLFGNLYLTDKRGGGEFDEDDEAIIVAFAGAAGVAIENARLYEDSRRRETWLQASAEITRSLLSGAETPRVLTLIARRARRMAGADTAAILLPEGGGLTLRVAIADGVPGPARRRRLPVEGSLAGQAFLRAEPRVVTELSDTDFLTATGEAGAACAVPLGAPGAVRGVLSLARRPGRVPFSRAEVCMVHSFAGHAAVALELDEARRDAERLGLLEDRDRIAKDLHDVVIQRLFAVAMTLTGATRLVERPEAAARLRTAIDELDGTIRQIRSTIFALRAPADAPGLRARLVELVEGAREPLGFLPALCMDGQLDTRVPAHVGDHLLAVAREAISNVVRHAHATRAAVTVRLDKDRLTLLVEDDGVGLPARGRRSGLRNLCDRAESLGGSCAAETGAAGGTRVCWSVPLPSTPCSTP
ncbi:Histidine kinase-, DNA gyrase B-, and HSP90-like ATPase [Microbispora rosea]|uniref:Histidine kinase-, DNA gyrase B-, and HSP90-like ATPase n=1 Tax=Microbispora rosea TaxID=58117 RepID=A0A1N6XD50_9ACTN|nr:GAF domain-containing sensor histidine kinase [Microbispora rosea]GIH52782.1 histidine kinase [Microbispora rosea subsp. rosea]SIR00161.1 Histidine kinase-, DNA gyrase B-, and HSP90-like ATPase [Microbispora rosea]